MMATIILMALWLCGSDSGPCGSKVKVAIVSIIFWCL